MNKPSVKSKISIWLVIIYGMLAFGAFQSFNLTEITLTNSQMLVIWIPTMVAFASIFYPKFLYGLLIYWILCLFDIQSPWVSWGLNPAYELNLYLTVYKTIKVKFDLVSFFNVILVRYLIKRTDLARKQK